jgi:hypothetical protein
LRSAKEAQGNYGGSRWAGTNDLLALLSDAPETPGDADQAKARRFGVINVLQVFSCVG